jgi:hypothetical protein
LDEFFGLHLEFWINRPTFCARGHTFPFVFAEIRRAQRKERRQDECRFLFPARFVPRRNESAIGSARP